MAGGLKSGKVKDKSVRHRLSELNRIGGVQESGEGEGLQFLLGSLSKSWQSGLEPQHGNPDVSSGKGLRDRNS